MKVRKGSGKFKWSALALFAAAMLFASAENADVVSAEETSDVVTLDGIEYTVDEETKTATVSEYSNKTSTECKEIVIPSVILYGENKYTVTTIGNGAFSQVSCMKHYHTSYSKDIKEHWYTCEVCKKEVRAVHGFGTGSQLCECGYVPFAITVHPSDLRLAYGYKNGSLSVAVKKTLGTESVSYQWYKDGKAISGATSGTYAIPTGRPVGKYTYTCKISSGGVLGDSCVSDRDSKRTGERQQV